MLPDTGAGGSEPPLPDLLQAAESFARDAGDLTLKHFGEVLRAEAKADGTPVTIADREAESLLRRYISGRFPEHGILGEEFGETNPGARVRWILDPIDGTRSFMRGVPLYAVLIGIELDGSPVCGVAHFPALGETVVAGRGLGCYWNGRRAWVSHCSTLPDALLLTTNAERMRSSPSGPGWGKLVEQAGLCRTWGDAYGHILVATGRAEVMVDPLLAPWDAGPLPTILSEAGGRFTTLDGRSTIHGGSGVSTNGSLHQVVLEGLSPRLEA